MPDIATLQTRLQEAESAYHQLACGTSEVTIVKGDRTVQYNQASLPTLRTYIADLRTQLERAGAIPPAPGGRRRLIEVVL